VSVMDVAYIFHDLRAWDHLNLEMGRSPAIELIDVSSHCVRPHCDDLSACEGVSTGERARCAGRTFAMCG